MYSKTLSLVTVVIAIFMLLLFQNEGRADTYNRATSNGHFKLDGVNGTAVNVNAYKTYTTSTNTTQIWGTLSVISNTMYANTTVGDASFTWVMLGGVSYKHAVITSKSFQYTDYTTNTTYSAHLIIALTQYGPYGQAGFQIVRDSDGVVTTQTTVNGVYGEVPFISGGVGITE